MLDLVRLIDGFDRFGSLKLFIVFAVLGLLAGLFHLIGLLGLMIRLVQRLFHVCTWLGFQAWKRVLSWTRWPTFLLLVFGLIGLGTTQGQNWPSLGLLTGLVLVWIGVITCMAYVYIDLERYEVARGYKALFKPVKGQELALNLAKYGYQLGAPLLILASIATVGGFALTCQGLYETVGSTWYHPEGDDGHLDFAAFLAYTLINLARVADILNVANNWHFLEVKYVITHNPVAAALMILFRTFFTLVLLQQIFASVRRGRLLSETIRDFWSPHDPIRMRARTSLEQYGPGAVRPLLHSMRFEEGITPDQWEDLPRVLSDIGPVSVPVLRGHLRDRNENVRGVAALALGELHALEALPRLGKALKDESERVRVSVAQALGTIAAPQAKALRKQILAGHAPAISLWSWVTRVVFQLGHHARLRANPLPTVVKLLRRSLTDTSLVVRTAAIKALGQVGPAAAEAAPDLITLLDEEDEGVRCAAAAALSEVRGPEEPAVVALRRLLHQPSPALQIAAAEALGTMKKAAAEAVQDLAPLLSDPNDAVRRAASEAVGAIGVMEHETVHTLTEGLHSPDMMVRAHTAEALGALGPNAGEAAQELAEALHDESDRVRAKAAEALGKLGEAAEEAVPRLMEALRDQDNWVSALAAEALGEIGHGAANAVPALTRSLKHVNPQVRGNAAEALGKMGQAAHTALPELCAAIKDPEDEVRRRGLEALGDLHAPTPEAQQAVLAALNDPHPGVRAAAIATVSKCPNLRAQAIEPLLRAVDDVSDQVKTQVPTALAHAGAEPRVLEALRKLLADPAPTVQTHAALALGKLGPDAAVAGPDLLEAARREEPAVRLQCLWALAHIQSSEAVPAFLAGLTDPEADVRKIASAGLIKAAIPVEALPDIIAALGDHENQVRANAAQILARLKEVPDEAVGPLEECLQTNDDGVRLHAAVALRSASPTLTEPIYRRLLEDADPRLRLLAAGFFLEQNPEDEGAAQILVECLSSPSRMVRKAALELITKMGENATYLLDPLRERAEAEIDPEFSAVLSQLIDRLAKLEAQAAAPVRAQ